jgi:hypothetical protein
MSLGDSTHTNRRLLLPSPPKHQVQRLRFFFILLRLSTLFVFLKIPSHVSSSSSTQMCAVFIISLIIPAFYSPLLNLINRPSIFPPWLKSLPKRISLLSHLCVYPMRLRAINKRYVTQSCFIFCLSTILNFFLGTHSPRQQRSIRHSERKDQPRATQVLDVRRSPQLRCREP